MANLVKILQEKVKGEYIKQVQETKEEQGKMLVMGKFYFLIQLQY